MEKINKFNPGRVMSLAGKIVMEQPKVFMMRILLLFGSLAIGTVFIGMVNLSAYRYINYYESKDISMDAEQVYFMVTFVVMGFVYTSMAFNEARNKPGRISMLMLPARYGEKYLAKFIIYIPLYIVMFAVAMWASDTIRVVVLKIFNPDIADRVHFLSIDDLWWKDIGYTLAFFLMMQSFYWLGAILWPRNSFIKSFTAVAVLSTFYTAVTPVLYLIIVGRDNNICRVEWLEWFNPEQWWVVWSVVAIVCSINYTLAYMRLKESDVIQRIL